MISTEPTQGPSTWGELRCLRCCVELVLLVLMVLACLRVLKLAGVGQLRPLPIALALAAVIGKMLLDALWPRPSRHRPPTLPHD
jgi:hypothetical protein